ncbi:MAG: Dipeptidyl-peptidase 5 [Chlamydiia bacterium]|nr:Dipeptidyl-peptidase 5 [Chlamydiia bacterium]
MKLAKQNLANYFFIFCLLSINLFSEETEEKIWRTEDVFQIKNISNVDISPDGKEVLYAVTTPQVEDGANHYLTQIWRGKVDDPKSHYQFTTDNTYSSSARWSPDGKTIAFISARTGYPQLYLIPPNGGEAVQITEVPHGVNSFRWSPDSQKIAFVSAVYNTPKEKDEKSLLCDEVMVFPDNRMGSSLHIVNAKASIQEPEVLTAKEYFCLGIGDFGTDIEAFDFSFDGKNIAFTYTRDNLLESQWKKPQIAIINLESKEIKKLPKLAPSQGIPKYSPDGKFIAFLKSDANSVYSIEQHIGLYSIEDESCRVLQKTPDEGAFLIGPSIMGWTEDGKSILFMEPSRTKYAIWKVPVNDGPITRFDDNKKLYSFPLLSYNRKWIGLGAQSITEAKEAFCTPASEFKPIQLTSVNEHLKEKPVAETIVIRWKSYDDTEIEGLLTYPKDYEEGKTYPLLVNIHGGPMSMFDEGYLGQGRGYPLAAMADAGFFILRPNPRGSCGYGLEFRKANHNDWGGRDYEDIMSGVDHVIEKGLVDENHMGVMGWSYGGYMTAWIVSQTDRFAAASMGAGLSNLISLSNTTDLRSFMSDYLGGEFWKDPKLYLERSAIMYSDKVNTPLLIQHGLLDDRVPVSQSIEFYNALHKLNKPVTLAIYPRSQHGVVEPKLRIDELQRNFDWFVKHLKNKD